ncbi:MAG: hypothetical protein K0R90_983 [Oscillospiraceae bacterium]|nr:hypothetical protein [Oscillospiraceae bacterium]
MMHKLKKHYFWIIGLGVAILSFILLCISFAYTLKVGLELQNFIAFSVLSIIYGGASAGLYLMKPKAGFVIFIISLIVGFFEMFRVYLKDMDGWGDLVGLMSLLLFSAIGLVAGLVLQLVIFIVKKVQAKHKSEEN